VAEALTNVSLPNDEAFLNRYPSQISVGQAQRVLIAMAILHRPALVIADEPTSALDLITQSEILQLFSDLTRKLGMSVLYISHDLLSVATISHRVAVMHAGKILECRPTGDLFRTPTDPYTRQLVRALPFVPQTLAATTR
jgi:ABC-type dipeptide/oligopeptide/nickel transport system ATPase component